MSSSDVESRSASTASAGLSSISDFRKGKVGATPATRIAGVVRSAPSSQSRRLLACAMIRMSIMTLAYRTFADLDGQFNLGAPANDRRLHILVNASLPEHVLEIVDIAQAAAVQIDEDIAEEHAGCICRGS